MSKPTRVKFYTKENKPVFFKAIKTTIIEKDGIKRPATRKESKSLKRKLAKILIKTAEIEIKEWQKFIKDIKSKLWTN